MGEGGEEGGGGWQPFRVMSWLNAGRIEVRRRVFEPAIFTKAFFIPKNPNSNGFVSACNTHNKDY